MINLSAEDMAEMSSHQRKVFLWRLSRAIRQMESTDPRVKTYEAMMDGLGE